MFVPKIRWSQASDPRDQAKSTTGLAEVQRAIHPLKQLRNCVKVLKKNAPTHIKLQKPHDWLWVKLGTQSWVPQKLDASCCALEKPKDAVLCGKSGIRWTRKPGSVRNLRENLPIYIYIYAYCIYIYAYCIYVYIYAYCIYVYMHIVYMYICILYIYSVYIYIVYIYIVYIYTIYIYCIYILYIYILYIYILYIYILYIYIYMQNVYLIYVCI